MQIFKKLIYKIPLYLFIIIAQAFQLFGVGIIALINGRPIECIIIYISFIISRNLFGNSFHAKTYWACTIVSWTVFWFLTSSVVPLNISIACSPLFGVGLSYIMHHVSYYFELKKFKQDHEVSSTITLFKGMDEELLVEAAKKKGLNDTEIKYLKWKYVDKLKDEEIAYRMNYSISRARDYVNMAKKKFNENKDLK